MKKTNKQKGITLIALVITIVILLILAGISIASLTQTGLFEKAQQAKQESENAQAEENAILENYLEQIDNIVENKDTKPLEAVPAEATVIESDLSKGIVIKDKKDNKWTWVVVPKTIFTTAKSASQYDKIETDLKKYASTYREGKLDQRVDFIDEWYDGCGIANSTTYTEMYNKMLSSVYTYGGFWISTYEAGIADTNTDTTSREIYLGRLPGSYKVMSGEAVSQENRIPYDYVSCSSAQKLASAMSSDPNKTSSLLFGIQWDLVCKYLEVTAFNGESSYLNVDSTNWGNYSNKSITLKVNSRYSTKPWDSSGRFTLYNEEGDFVQKINDLYKTNSATSCYALLTTGASEDTNKMNIYDFAGNEGEFTLEHSPYKWNEPSAVRGGSYGDAGILVGSPASTRSSYGTGASCYISFRSTLY